MKQLFTILAIFLLASCQKTELKADHKVRLSEEIIPEEQTASTTAAAATTGTLPVPKHITFIWFENKGYSKIVGSADAPYINSLLKRGTLFAKAYGVTHPSYPNYITWYSGSTQGVTDDACRDKTYYVPTVYSVLWKRGISFRWYSEDLPYKGYKGCSWTDASYRKYVEKHNPTTLFPTMAVESGNSEGYMNVPLASMKLTNPANYKYLPKVSCVTPNMQNDMHDGSIAKGDAWLKANFSKLIDSSFTQNSIVVIYFDENDGKTMSPMPVVMLGQHIKKGYKNTDTYNHYSFAKTVCKMFGADITWSANIKNAKVITGVYR